MAVLFVVVWGVVTEDDLKGIKGKMGDCCAGFFSPMEKGKDVRRGEGGIESSLEFECFPEDIRGEPLGNFGNCNPMENCGDKEMEFLFLCVCGVDKKTLGVLDISGDTEDTERGMWIIEGEEDEWG